MTLPSTGFRPQSVGFLASFALHLVIHFFSGLLMGIMFAGVSFVLAGEHFEFGAGFGVPIGIFFGSVHAVLSYLPLKRYLNTKTYLVLLASTVGSGLLALGVTVLFVDPEMGPPLCAFACLIGYWVGVVVIGLELRPDRSRT